MRRAFLLLGLLALLGGALVASAADSEKSSTDYWVELDNAFGLVEGADVKVAGVRAGKITEMDIDRRRMRALVGLDITREGFGDLRADVFCETRPQSLIGEYFVDCDPGKAARRLERGSRIPVRQTASTVPVDLVNSIMRRPYRERLSILLSELGAGLAARGDDLNVTIRRAVPALRETDKVLAKLARQRRTIRDLNDDADTVLKALADARGDVVRFVREAGDTTTIQASRSPQLRAQFQELPGFLRELRPTMRSLGQAADDQAPTLRTLAANSGPLQEFLGGLADFSTASRPAVRSLAAAARKGRPAVDAARPQVRRLDRAARPLPELAKNLAITLEALDDPERAVEKDPRSPRGGKGYTGLEALLRYIWGQVQATNVYDSEGHLLKVSAFLDLPCALYADAKAAKRPDLDKCNASLGPSRPGITSPDPTASATRRSTVARRGSTGRDRDDEREAPAAPAPAPAAPAPPATTAPEPAPVSTVTGLLDALVDRLRPGAAGDDAGAPAPPRSAAALLDYLLGSGG